MRIVQMKLFVPTVVLIVNVVMTIYPFFGFWVFGHIDRSRWLRRSNLVKLLNKI